MTPFPWIDLAIIVALIALNGVFAMTELAIVSSRRPRLQAIEKGGNAGATAALKLSEDPGKFLSTVQIGITLISVIAGAYSGASLGGPVAERLELWFAMEKDLAHDAGFGIVIVLTTFLSLIIGELVPKQFALRSPEPIAAIMARPMLVLSRIAAPFVWLLDQTSRFIFHLIGMSRESENHVTAEELHLVVAEATRSGIIDDSERQIISGVVRLADRPVREVMTPRTDVDSLDASADPETILAFLRETPHTRIPVTDGSPDNVVGVVQSRDIARTLLRGETIDIRALLHKAVVVPDTVEAMDALNRLRGADVPMIFVHDEYGQFEGLVTPSDLLSAIAGQFASDHDIGEEPDVVERADGSLLISGSMSADALAERLGIALDDDRDYATAAGHALAVLKRLPEVGDMFEDQDWRYEVVDMDGRKIDKLLVSYIGEAD